MKDLFKILKWSAEVKCCDFSESWGGRLKGQRPTERDPEESRESRDESRGHGWRGVVMWPTDGTATSTLKSIQLKFPRIWSFLLSFEGWVRMQQYDWMTDWLIFYFILFTFIVTKHRNTVHTSRNGKSECVCVAMRNLPADCLHGSDRYVLHAATFGTSPVAAIHHARALKPSAPPLCL